MERFGLVGLPNAGKSALFNALTGGSALVAPHPFSTTETNVGVARLMDFIAKYGSSPVDRATVKAIDINGADVEVTLNGQEPVCYVFKTMSEAHFGELSFFRVYSGHIHSGTDLFNSDRKVTERAAHHAAVGELDRALRHARRLTRKDLRQQLVGQLGQLAWHRDATLGDLDERGEPVVQRVQPVARRSAHLLEEGQPEGRLIPTDFAQRASDDEYQHTASVSHGPPSSRRARRRSRPATCW